MSLTSGTVCAPSHQAYAFCMAATPRPYENDMHGMVMPQKEDLFIFPIEDQI
jgi:hypothetical protein